MKASKREIRELVIGQLVTGYTPRWNIDRDPVKYAELVDLLITDIDGEHYDIPTLTAGMAIFRREWTYARWPVFAELNEFLRKGRAQTKPLVEAKTPRDDGEEWAAGLLRSNNGQQAIHDGLALALWDWGRRHPGEKPTSDDMREMRRDTQARIDRCDELRAGSDPFGLLQIGDGMARKNAELSKRYGVAA